MRILRLGAALFLATPLCFATDSTPNQSTCLQTPAAPAASASLAPAAPPSPVPQNPLGEANAFMRSGNFDAALEKFQQVLRDSPKSPDANAGIIRAYLKKKDITGAADAAIAALAISDTHTVRTAVAELHFRQGKISEAEREWVEVINSGYPDARAYLGLARVRRSVSMYKSAYKMIHKAYELDPSDPDIQRAWITTLSPAERIKYLEQFLNGPNDQDAQQRSDTQHYLDYLKARVSLPKHGCRLVSKITATETPLVRLLIDPQHLRGFGLSVFVNGHKSDLLLDTGASGILLNRPAAEKAGITRISDTRVAGIGDKGSKHGYMAVADSIRVGDLEFQNCNVEVIESRSVNGESGLIGADIFGSFLVDIDFPDEKFKLAELPKRPDEPAAPVSLEADEESGDSSSASDSSKASAQKSDANPAPQLHDRYIAAEMKSFTSIFRFGHELLIPTIVGNLTTRKLFLIDTGAMGNLMSTTTAAEVTKVRGDPHTHIEGISGSVKNVYSADKAMLEFGNLRQPNEDVTAFDFTHLSDDTGTEVSGLLGFATFRMVEIKIDYRDGLVDFFYDPKRWGR